MCLNVPFNCMLGAGLSYEDRIALKLRQGYPVYGVEMKVIGRWIQCYDDSEDVLKMYLFVCEELRACWMGRSIFFLIWKYVFTDSITSIPILQTLFSRQCWMMLVVNLWCSGISQTHVGCTIRTCFYDCITAFMFYARCTSTPRLLSFMGMVRGWGRHDSPKTIGDCVLVLIPT